MDWSKGYTFLIVAYSLYYMIIHTLHIGMVTKIVNSWTESKMGKCIGKLPSQGVEHIEVYLCEIYR